MKKTKQPEYKHYRTMINNCYPKNTTSYYKKRNIIVCDRWLGTEGFYNFLEDVGRKPSKKYILRRIDTKDNYVKSNCEWSLSHTKQKNRIILTYQNKTKPLSEWCNLFNINYYTAYSRFKNKLSPAEILDKRRRGQRVLYKNKLYTVTELCNKYNLDKGMIYWRLRARWSMDDVVEEPNQKDTPTRREDNPFYPNSEERRKKVKQINKRKKYIKTHTYENYNYFYKKNAKL